MFYSDRGPSCNDDAQLSGKKVILIRFIPSTDKKKSIPTDFSDNKEVTTNMATASLTTSTITTSRVKKRKASKIYLYRGCIKGWQTCYSKAGDCQ